jgi:hypothetical protein
MYSLDHLSSSHRFRSPLATHPQIFRSDSHVQISGSRFCIADVTATPGHPPAREIRADSFHEGGSQQRPKFIARIVQNIFYSEYSLGLKRIKTHWHCSKALNPKTMARKNTIFSICLHLIPKVKLIFFWGGSGKYIIEKKQNPRITSLSGKIFPLALRRIFSESERSQGTKPGMSQPNV